MNFNIYLNKKTGELITKMAKNLHRSRNSIIVEALDEWLECHSQSQWPENFFNFTPITDIPDFKANRDELLDLGDKDPLE